MKIFEDFTEFGVFTVAFLLIAIVGGIAALIKKQHAKRAMLITGIAEAVVLVAALITFAVRGTSSAVFADISLGTGLYTAMVVILLAFMAVVMVISARKDTYPS